MEAMETWNSLAHVPKSALKTIVGGRLKGKSDINPQWRYQALTEKFGLCGFGWKYTIEKQWMEKYDNGEIACFVNVNFFVNDKDNGWSDAIPANGGSMFVSNERNGVYVSDECYKMAITDAIGTAAKMIGLAADVYLGKTDNNIYPQTKYDKPESAVIESKPLLSKGDKLNKAMEFLRTAKDSKDAMQKLETIRLKYTLTPEIENNLQTLINQL
jgi:nickel-dependent lactate racemase